MDDSTKCKCCGRTRAALSVCYKPSDELFRVALCNRCFDVYKINADFLQTCMECGPGADFRPFRELQEESEAVTA